ncbi:hypothetical protein Taro_004586 [Colocasia esculenta]|uniref:Uncharacterized protein n=1 Tax=Colocasia esculenta TaxID=4460 RepID=A0A843TKI8_COLES|nr:hypothetical protein [Colocasia esculenta]
MVSDGGSYSGSRPRRQRIAVQQTFPTHSASEGSAAAALTVGSTTSVAANTDKEMLMHMSSMHRTWRGVLKKRNIDDRNKANRSHQSMPYRKGRKSHYQLKDDFERIFQLSTPSLDSESGSTPISAEEAFVSVMGKNRSGRIRCGGSRETRRTWYGTREGSSTTDYQQQISNIENTLRMEVEKLHTEARRRDSEMDEMRGSWSSCVNESLRWMTYVDRCCK